jgi:hypothetical protein
MLPHPMMVSQSRRGNGDGARMRRLAWQNGRPRWEGGGFSVRKGALLKPRDRLRHRQGPWKEGISGGRTRCDLGALLSKGRKEIEEP